MVCCTPPSSVSGQKLVGVSLSHALIMFLIAEGYLLEMNE